jgi:8-oxo-dGTP diphosphatase
VFPLRALEPNAGKASTRAPTGRSIVARGRLPYTQADVPLAAGSENASVTQRPPKSDGAQPPPECEPKVDLRVVLLTVAGSALYIAVAERDGHPALPRGVPVVGESLDETARQLTRSAAGLDAQYLEQLYTVSVVDQRQHAIVVSYLALIGSGSTPPSARGMVWTATSASGGLSDVDRMVADYALVRLRAKLGYTNIAFYLMPATFTLTELQTTYEAVLGQQLDKRNFRRRITASGILEATEEKRREGSHRPAAVYRFSPEHDHATYLTPTWTT